MMPAVRAHMVFAALGDHGEMLSCRPATEEVELFDGRVVEAWLISDHEEHAIAATAARCPRWRTSSAWSCPGRGRTRGA